MFLTVNAGLCETTRNTAMSTAITKFLLAMGGVALSSIIIYAGLTVYTNFLLEIKVIVLKMKY